MSFKSALRSFDVWAAKRLFFPIIVRVCQKLGLDQYGFAGYCSVVAVMFFIPVAFGGGFGESVVGKVVVIFIAVVMIVLVGITGRLLSAPRPFWRAWGWAMLVKNVLTALFLGIANDQYLAASWLFMLFAEYAFMIDRIPPIEKKEAEIRAAEAHL